MVSLAQKRVIVAIAVQEVNSLHVSSTASHYFWSQLASRVSLESLFSSRNICFFFQSSTQ